MSYFYIENEKDFEKEYPFENQYIRNYPTTYPCVLKVEHEGGGLMGNFYDIEIIEDLSDFIYKDGCLYKRC